MRMRVVPIHFELSAAPVIDKMQSAGLELDQFPVKEQLFELVFCSSVQMYVFNASQTYFWSSQCTKEDSISRDLLVSLL